MKTWVQPLAIVDKFVANEYVAACWTVSCQVPYENQGYDPFAPGNTNLLHRPDNCGATDGFTVFTNENNVAYKIVQGKAGGSSRTADLSGNICDDLIHLTERGAALCAESTAEAVRQAAVEA